MWFEILPSFCIVTAGIGVPYLIAVQLHKTFLDNPYRRWMHGPLDRFYYMRDRGVKHVYDPVGLEGVPDE